MATSIFKDRNTFTIAVTYNFVPYDDAKYEDEQIADEHRWCLLAKRKHSANILVRYNADELEHAD